jgi:hypothetical protein
MKTLLVAGVLGIVAIGVVLALLRLSSSETSETTTQGARQDAFKILVQEDGFYRFSLEELPDEESSTADFLEPEMRLSQGGRPAHFLLDGDDFIFYGRRSDSRYSATRPYILELGTSGPSMSEALLPAVDEIVSSVPQTLHFEHNLIYDSRARQPGSINSVGEEPWFWATIQTGESLPIEIDLPGLAGGGGQLRIRLWGATHNSQVDLDHDFELLINDQPVDTIRWDGESYLTGELTLPPGILRSGANTIVIDNSDQGAAPLDIFRLDWIDLEIAVNPVAVDNRFTFKDVAGEVEVGGFDREPFLFEISDPDRPGVLSGRQFSAGTSTVDVSQDMHVAAVGPEGFLAPKAIVPLTKSDLAAPDSQADLLIISAGELRDSLQPLIEAREEQGLAVSAVSLEEIYDEFGHGEVGPDSITNFLRFASERWADPKPRYLLLVGEASYDYRGYLGEGPRNQLPPPLVPVSFGGETVSDGRLADVDGDDKPDLAVGRWPVSDPEAVNALVRRTLAYEAGSAPSGAIFAADGTSLEFSSLSDRVLASSKLDSGNVEKLYGLPEAEFADAWSQGAWLVSYAGHGSLDRWGKDDVFSADSVSALRSVGPPPIVLQLTCLTGFFAHPSATSISEQMLLHPDGPVLLVAATSLTLSSSQEPFGVSFLRELQNPAVTRIGDAFLRAKLALDFSNFGLQEVSDTFGLLGDPSTPIVRPITTGSTELAS